MESNVIFQTSGKGWWSKSKKSVKITDMKIGYISDYFEPGSTPDYGELRVYFDTSTWDTSDDGLIYTDEKFMKQLREFLKSYNILGTVSYTEQGMQGDDYVSCGVDEKFLQSWGEKFGVNWDEFLEIQTNEFNKTLSRLTRNH